MSWTANPLPEPTAPMKRDDPTISIEPALRKLGFK